MDLDDEVDELAVAENRWQHLLKPIRDLAENWNINIAHDLEEYLNELAAINDSGKTPNFAEAGLLIHGSVGVYSKKVEHLYHLVTQTLELLISKKLKKPTSIAEDGSDKDLVRDEEPEFLPLDDLQEATNIDMNEIDGISESNTFSKDLGILSFGSRREGQQDEDDVQFQMRNCMISDTGALLLGQTASFLDLGFEETPTYHMDPSSTLPTQLPASPPHTHPDDNSQDQSVPFHGLPEDDEDDLPIDLPPMDVEDHAPNTDTPATPPPSQLPTTKRKGKSQSDNPWEAHDPHDPTESLVVKPFKRGNTAKIPAECLPEEANDSKAQPKSQEPANTSFTLRPTYPEFQYLYDREMKARKAKKREAASRHPQAPATADMPRFEQIGLRDESDPEESEEEPLVLPSLVPQSEWPTNAAALELGMANMLIDDSKRPEETSYNDLCRSYFEQYLQDAKQYALETDQSRRIEVWKSKLQPLLIAQDKRPSYNIHSFAANLLSSFPAKNKTTDVGAVLPFSDLVEGKPSWEICRAFVATLHMVNSGNIDLNAERDLVNGNDAIRCKLLSRLPPKDIENFNLNGEDVHVDDAPSEKTFKDSDVENESPPEKPKKATGRQTKKKKV